MEDYIYHMEFKEFEDYTKLYNKIKKLCSKYGISCQQNVSFNGDMHLQFRRPNIYGSIKDPWYNDGAIDFAECYISSLELRSKRYRKILRNLKGFLIMSFKNCDKPRGDQNVDNVGV